MDQAPDKQKNIPNKTAKPAKWSIVGRFLKDVGHFIFDEKTAGDEVKKDLAALEMTRAEERAAAKAAKAKAEAEAKAKREEAKKRAEAEAKAKFLAAKMKTADRFRKERDEIIKRKQIIAEQILKAKASQAAVKPPAKHGFSWFKKSAKPIQAPSAPAAPLAAPTAPKADVHEIGLPPINLSQAPAPAGVGKITDKEKSAKKFQDERLKHETSHQREQIENRPWQSYNIVATNLIREQRSMFLNWQGKLLLLALFVSLSILICVLAYGFLLILEKDTLNKNDYVFKNLDGVVSQIKAEEVTAQDILKFNDKLLAVDYLLKNHIYWTNLFKFLEDNTINDVYYESFSGDTVGKYAIPAVAKDFRSISLQLRVLQAVSDKVVSVDSGGAATDKTAAANAAPTTPANGVATSTPNVKFNLNLSLNRSIFIKAPDYGN